MHFELFDPDSEFTVREGRLPHWYQPGVTYFVTFRTIDSVPQSLIRSWHRRRDQWLARQGLDPRGATWKSALQEMPGLEREYHNSFSRPFMEYLDRGEGACELANPDLASIMATSLREFDGDRYHLGDFVVMPNHVHVLVCLIGTTELEPLCRSWKKLTATEINRQLGRGGHFWQSESFDHLVRSPEQFCYLRSYIANNPRKAGLRSGEYLLHSSW